MREKNTGEPRTDFSPPGRLLLASAASLLFLAAGCGGAGVRAKNIWENTKKTVSDTLVSISKYQRESPKKQRGAEKPGASEAKAAAASAAARPFREPLPSRKRPPRNVTRAKSAPFQDRFPSRGHSPKEEDLHPGEARGAGERTAREAPLPPGALMDPEELRQRIQDVRREERRARRASRRRRLAQERGRLERMLRKSRKEEEIIREMEQLRERLRELQKDLLEIQRAGR